MHLSKIRPVDDLELVKPREGESRWIASVGEKTPMRLSSSLALVLKWLIDGQKGKLSSYLGASITKEQLNEAISLLENAGLITSSDNLKVKSSHSVEGRVRVKSLFSIQFAVFHKDKHFRWLKVFANKWILILFAGMSIFFGLSGIVLIFTNVDGFYSDLTTPQTLQAVILIYFSLVVSLSLHEFAHAVVLMYYGGRVRRMGIMIFYLSPAFFCDVTEAWKLPYKEQRVKIALAGVWSTFGIAGIFSIVHEVFLPDVQWMSIVVAILYFGSVMNLLPFIKLDGYIALMSYLDEPNLRKNSMEEWKIAFVRIFAKHTTSSGVFSFNPIRLIYGLGASITPLLMLGLLAYRIADAGGVGQVIGSFVLMVVVVLLIRGVCSIVHLGRVKFQLSRSRSLVLLICSVALCLFIGLFPIPQNNTASFWLVDNKKIVTDAGISDCDFSRVDLVQDGLLWSEKLGTGRLGESIGKVSVPIQELEPRLVISDSFSSEKVVLKDVRLLEEYRGKNPHFPGTVILGREVKSIMQWLFEKIWFFDAF